MRKLILQMQLSADGFVAGPKGELADEISTLKQKKAKTSLYMAAVNLYLP